MGTAPNRGPHWPPAVPEGLPGSKPLCLSLLTPRGLEGWTLWVGRGWGEEPRTEDGRILLQPVPGNRRDAAGYVYLSGTFPCVSVGVSAMDSASTQAGRSLVGLFTWL